MCDACDSEFIKRTFTHHEWRHEYDEKDSSKVFMIGTPKFREEPTHWEEVLDASLCSYQEWLEALEASIEKNAELFKLLAEGDAGDGS